MSRKRKKKEQPTIGNFLGDNGLHIKSLIFGAIVVVVGTAITYGVENRNSINCDIRCRIGGFATGYISDERLSNHSWDKEALDFCYCLSKIKYQKNQRGEFKANPFRGKKLKNDQESE